MPQQGLSAVLAQTPEGEKPPAGAQECEKRCAHQALALLGVQAQGITYTYQPREALRSIQTDHYNQK